MVFFECQKNKGCDYLPFQSYVQSVLVYLIRFIVKSNSHSDSDLTYLIKSFLVPVLCYASPSWSNSGKQDQKGTQNSPGAVNLEIHSKKLLRESTSKFFQDCLSESHSFPLLIPDLMKRAS